MKALLQAVVRDLLGNLDILDEALADISRVLGCINVNLKAEAINDSDLNGLKRVQLGHALHLSEFDIIAILEFMSFIFMHCNN